MEIRTRDGDVATIHLDSSFSAERSAQYAYTGSRLSFDTESSVSRMRKLSFRVEGDLDEDELEAIRKLVGKAEKLSNRFYAGDIETALKKAGRLGFDDEEIAGFSLELHQTVETQATAAYREVMELGGEQPHAEDAELAGLLQDYLENGEHRSLFEDGAQIAADLLQGVVESDDDAAEEPAGEENPVT
jgi:hypothetical protein